MSVYSSSDTQWSLTNSTFNKEHEVHTASEWLKVVVQSEFHIYTFLTVTLLQTWYSKFTWIVNNNSKNKNKLLANKNCSLLNAYTL